jgi:hypothetical protein
MNLALLDYSTGIPDQSISQAVVLAPPKIVPLPLPAIIAFRKTFSRLPEKLILIEII